MSGWGCLLWAPLQHMTTRSYCMGRTCDLSVFNIFFLGWGRSPNKNLLVSFLGALGVLVSWNLRGRRPREGLGDGAELRFTMQIFSTVPAFPSPMTALSSLENKFPVFCRRDKGRHMLLRWGRCAHLPTFFFS